MTLTENSAPNSFVLMQLGERRFALPAKIVTELAPPVRLHTFPHASPLVSGVIVRRARIVPVYDASSILIGKQASGYRFYLIARRDFGKTSELSAIPVDGECELGTGEMQPAPSGKATYVAGILPVGEESLDVLDLEALLASHPKQSHATAPAAAEKVQL
jgi:chemotaxis signal transduction protein